MSTGYKLKILHNKKIAVLGLGIENYALVKYLLKCKIKCEITICDAKINVGTGLDLSTLLAAKNIYWQLGKNSNRGLEKFDILFRSPGWPIDCPGIVEARKKKPPYPPLPARLASQSEAGRQGGLSSPIKLFFQLCPTKNIIGVTGTKGKGTTASLIYDILKKAGKRVWLGGNIGVAPFEFIDKIKKHDWVVLELSSFQLEDINVSPHIAVITNFYPEHLAAADPNNPNFHKSLKDYRDAKLNILRWQQSGDKAILNYELRIKNYGLRSKIYTFSAKNQKANCFWLDENKIKYNRNTHNSLFIIHTSLLGEHNKENIAAAVAVAQIMGVRPEITKKAVANFKDLEHRIEFVKIINGVKYYDDSFATTPESTIIALDSFKKPIILLAGGAEKKSDFKKLASKIKSRVKFLILLNGKATPRIKKEVVRIGLPVNKIKLVFNMKSAVDLARKNSLAGGIVLLSPACASFGMFKNYKQRGNLFKSEVKKLTPWKFLKQPCQLGQKDILTAF